MSKSSKTKVERDEVNDDVEALFRVPLAEFTGAGGVAVLVDDPCISGAGRRTQT